MRKMEGERENGKENEKGKEENEKSKGKRTEKRKGLPKWKFLLRKG